MLTEIKAISHWNLFFYSYNTFLATFWIPILPSKPPQYTYISQESLITLSCMFLSLTHTRTTHTKHQDFMENLNSSFVWMPKTISNILLEVSMIDDFSKKSTRLDSYVHLLEEEMRKIQVFQRELPQCMNLIQDGLFLLSAV